MENIIDKIKFIAKEIAKQRNEIATVDIIENSEFVFDEVYNRFIKNQFFLTIKANPATYTKYYDDLERIEGLIHQYLNTTEEIKIITVKIKVDHEKILVLNTEISTVQTPWEEINRLQQELVEKVKNSKSSIDFQNIGNTSRTIMDKLARLVFKSEIHIAPKEVDVSNGKFKNQLHTYIQTVMKGAENKELRQFSLSAIDFTEDAIDLMNQTTHKLDVQRHFAEVCAISTISVISLIKAINEI